MTQGFLSWWTQERSRFNEDIIPYPEQVRGECGFVDVDGKIRVENLLAYKIGGTRRRFVYPYFCEKPSLAAEPARLGLWAVSTALAKFDPDIVGILDVLRGTEARLTPTLLKGDEQQVLARNYSEVLAEWQTHF